jgi:PKD repeat protein
MSGCPAKKIITIGAVIAIIALLFPFSVSCSKPPAPIAAFKVSYVSGELLIVEDPIAGTIPLTVRFSDQSSGKISSWRWNLGDGTVVEGSGEEQRNFVHTYTVPNSSGYIILLTVRGPGGKHQWVEEGVVAVYTCSEAANVELGQARKAIKDCLSAAGETQLDSPVPVTWNGNPGIVMTGGRDAADFLGVWKPFKATYAVDLDGTITSGTDVDWRCVKWTQTGMGWRWGAN